MRVEYEIGDCLEVLADKPEASFDSCVTDPPYGLEFMGKPWDKVEVYSFSEAWGKAVYRVLKPGAWLLSFGGTRTFHRMTCALEDVGFEIRDCMMWLYGSGFPKSYDISKGIDKQLGKQREIIGPYKYAERVPGSLGKYHESHVVLSGATKHPENDTAPASPEARQWNGWGTALKPAWEPIVVARKPLEGTVVENTLKHGCGGINVDGCRIGFQQDDFEKLAQNRKSLRTIREGAVAKGYGMKPEGFINSEQSPFGRWPSNLVLDEEAAKMLDEQSGVLESGSRAEGVRSGMGYFGGKGDGGPAIDGDFEGASRFFYTAKASRSERERGVKGPKHPNPGVLEGRAETPVGATTAPARNHHPTVKPLDLMRYLVRLVTPKDGICLDPFLGSGTTLLALRLEGLSGLGIEKNQEYEPIIKGRLEYIPPPLEAFA